MRLFIAIELSDNVKKTLVDLTEELRLKTHGWKWIGNNSLHITLKFLDEVDACSQDIIQDCMLSSICEKFMLSFDLKIASLGVFPSIRRPSVLWCGLAQDSAILEKMASSIENEFEGIGFQKEERLFHSHITIARASKETRVKSMNALIETYRERVFAAFTVSAISLVKSTLTPKGAIYETLFQVPLDINLSL